MGGFAGHGAVGEEEVGRAGKKGRYIGREETRKRAQGGWGTCLGGEVLRRRVGGVA